MPQPDEIVREHYAAQARQAEATLILARRQWRRMSPDDLDSSWARIVATLVSIVTDGQVGAAKAGAAYVPLALGVAGYEEPAAGSVSASRLAGIASDGRPLDSLLFSSVIHAKAAIGRGETVQQALSVGRAWLSVNINTQVADAGRGGAGVAIAARPRVEYERLVSPPCCQRCAVLAGKRFTWNRGFLRHPKCRCRHFPVSETDRTRYTGDIQADQVRDLTEAQRKAIGDGADLNQVINAHRKGARSAGGLWTSEGTTRHGLAGQRAGQRRGQKRFTPEGIYRVSNTREEAVRRLRDNGYLL